VRTAKAAAGRWASPRPRSPTPRVRC
jgi:hypothetical protein